MPIDLAPPDASFASDNTAGAHPAVLEALVAAADGPALAYGADPWTARAAALISSVFAADTRSFFTFGGTGANVVALASVLRPWEAVICTANAHVATDECGAPERMAGIKLLEVTCPDGKLDPAAIEPLLQFRGDEHHVQPRGLYPPPWPDRRGWLRACRTRPAVPRSRPHRRIPRPVPQRP